MLGIVSHIDWRLQNNDFLKHALRQQIYRLVPIGGSIAVVPQNYLLERPRRDIKTVVIV